MQNSLCGKFLFIQNDQEIKEIIVEPIEDNEQNIESIDNSVQDKSKKKGLFGWFRKN